MRHDIWDSRRFPLKQCRTFRILDGRVRFFLVDEGLHRDLEDYSCVWQRRPGRPLCEALPVHPEDLEYAALQSQAFYEASESLFASSTDLWPRITWVNKPGHAARAESKMLQLATAVDVGLLVPPTIISNSPQEVRQFLTQHGSVICKSLDPFRWVEDGQAYCNLSARVDSDSLTSDRTLLSCPEIYQVEIKRSRELRLFFSGPFEAGVEIRAPEGDRSNVDWRLYHDSRSATRALAEIPRLISRSCRKLLDRMGLVTASIDLLEDGEGRVFLADVNQAGQFLWMEDFGVKVVEGFTSFLTGVASGDLDLKEGGSIECLEKGESLSPTNV